MYRFRALFIAQDDKKTKIITISTFIVNSMYTISYLIGVPPKTPKSIAKSKLIRVHHHLNVYDSVPHCTLL